MGYAKATAIMQRKSNSKDASAALAAQNIQRHSVQRADTCNKQVRIHLVLTPSIIDCFSVLTLHTAATTLKQPCYALYGDGTRTPPVPQVIRNSSQ